MGTLLSKRSLLLIAGSILLFLSAYFYFSIRSESKILLEKDIKNHILQSVKKIEKELERRLAEIKRRAYRIREAQVKGFLKYQDLDTGEAIIKYEDNRIRKYAGDVYFGNMKDYQYNSNGWCLVQKDSRYFILIKLKNNSYYSNVFAEKKEIIDFFSNRYLSRNVSFAPAGLTLLGAKELDFFWSRSSYHGKKLLDNSNGQLEITVTTPEELDVREKLEEQEAILYVLLFMLGLLLRYYVLSIRNFRTGVLISVIFECFCFFALYQIADYAHIGTVYLDNEFLWINSVGKMLLWGLILYYLQLKLIPFITNSYIAVAGALTSILVAVKVAGEVIGAVQFSYSHFSFRADYILLITVLILIHMVPLLWCKAVKKSLPDDITGAVGGKVVFAGLIFTIAFLIAGYTLFYYSMLLLLLLMGFSKKKLFYRVLSMFLIAVSVFTMLEKSSGAEKERYVKESLINIFRNQGNYAKLVTREIIYEIRSEVKDFRELLDGKNHYSLLERIWSYSLAAGERVPSGIFLLDKNRKLLSSFVYKIPSYIEVGETESFSFWTIEEKSAEVFGKKVPIALGSIRVNDRFENIGYIQVVVINSSELLYKDPFHLNIFNLDEKIRNMEIGYVRLDKDGFIIENPSNIDVSDIPGLVKKDEGEVDFRYLGQRYKGHLFKDRGEKVSALLSGIFIYSENRTYNKNIPSVTDNVISPEYKESKSCISERCISHFFFQGICNTYSYSSAYRNYFCCILSEIH